MNTKVKQDQNQISNYKNKTIVLGSQSNNVLTV